MKRFSLFILGFVLTNLLVAQRTETRNLSPFNKIHVSEGIDVTIALGAEESAEVMADGIDLEDVLTEVEGNTLRVHLDGNNHRNFDVEVLVTYKSLKSLKASSAGSIKGTNIIEAPGDFEIDVSSAGDISVKLRTTELDVEASSAGDVDLEVVAESIDIEISSAGEVDASGRVESAEIVASSSGDFSGYELQCEKADLRASSGGSIKITVNDDLEARASSGGSIRYKGSPKFVDKESSSGGSIRQN